MPRCEFSRKVRAEIILRATNAGGVVTCEGCGLVLGKKPFEVDHTLPEALRDHTGRAPLTAADGKLLGKACCHAPKTADDIRRIRKADRQRDKFTRAVKPKAGLTNSRFKKRMDGTVVDRRTGETL
ncbi:hypothetical protein NKH61_05420 [Mesorhizobium sp. M1005]|uniref:hypothetical protein n=1 Tax=unclassified Mesorhizobium TaxID=325217 RepID=UPI0033356066